MFLFFRSTSLAWPEESRRLSNRLAAFTALAFGASALAVAQTPPAAPVISPLGTTFTAPQAISISDSTPGAVLYYVINGGTPIKYTAPFTASGSETVQAVAVTSASGSYTMGPVNTQNYTLPASWTQLAALPSSFTSQGGILVNVGDGNLYGMTNSGAQPHVVTSVYVASQSDLTKWTNITSASLSANGTEYPGTMGMTPNGTIFLSESNGSGLADVFYWNGSTSAPAWKKVTGWNGSSPSRIYNFTNDSAGYTYFSPAWSGNIWRNDAPNSTNFTLIHSNIYGLTGAGGPTVPSTGGIYQTRIFDLGDGKGDMLWVCGEGGLSNVDLKFTTFTNYLVAPGYRGNCTALDKSPTNILALRTADSNLDMLNSIDIATRGTTIHHSAKPRTKTGFPSALDTNLVGDLHWMNGTNWLFSGRDANNTSLTYLLLSQDDGNTWTDITASGAINSSCTSTNLSIEALVTTHYVFARCQGGKAFWQYGPI